MLCDNRAFNLVNLLTFAFQNHYKSLHSELGLGTKNI